jgi:HAD superfamily hydrolase (TIGR01509 family)
MKNGLKAILFDFGGVIAEEGFYEGLLEIGRINGLNPEIFFSTVNALIEETGYLTGLSDETAFWNAVREKTGILMSNTVLKDEIIRRFKPRIRMLKCVDLLRSSGFVVAILSDHTNWLDEIDEQISLFQHFDRVFNSFHIHKSKRDATVFRDVCAELNVRPDEALFIDDNDGHVHRARSEGLQVIRYLNWREFENNLRQFIAVDFAGCAKTVKET